MTSSRTREVLEEGLRRGAYPAVACEVGRAAGPLWRTGLGRLSHAPDAQACDTTTLFDLASLTKVIATTSVMMRHVRRGAADPVDPVRRWVPEWEGERHGAVTLGHLLDHSSGLPAHLRLWEQATDASSLRSLVLQVPTDHPPGTRSIYSDIGFMVLGCALESIGGASLESQWRALWPGEFPFLSFNPPRALWPSIAPTELDPWRGRLLQGEVHDEHAALLGGAAAHAGLFGAVDAVGVFASTVLRSFHEDTWLASPDIMRTFAARRPVPGSSRALGWDTMLPTSSCGHGLSATAIGHTGFTGTSLWIDRAQDLYIVLLTNRVHPTRTNELFLPMRARIHDAIVADLAG